MTTIPAFTISGITRPELFLDPSGNIILTPAAQVFAGQYGLKALYLGVPAGTPWPPVPGSAIPTPVDSVSTPVDIDATANSVLENAAVNTPVNITANSTSSAGAPIVYSLTADSSGGGFKIDPNTGVVSVANSSKIDFESAPSHAYTITVQANDGIITSSQSFTIGVVNVNEAPSGTNATITTNEDTPRVLTVADFGYSDVEGNALANVRINAVSGSGLTLNGNPLAAGDVIPVAEIVAGHLVYTPAGNVSGAGLASFTFQVQDDGGTANGGHDLDPAAKTMTINVASVNDVPSFTAGANQTVLEDSGAHTVNGFATGISPGPADEAGQAVNFLITTDNDALFSVVPSIDASGNLTYTLAANAFGTATVTVRAHDNGGTANGGVDTSAGQTFTVTATGVNDAPSFTIGPDQSAPEDSGAHTVNGFANSISAGPNETGQALNFIVSNNNNALFAVQPSIDASGNLTYTPAANANGSATVSVALHDDGGTANGGVDTSALQTFTINVPAVNDVPSFTVGADQITLEDSGAHTVNGFVTAISAGPADEAGQTVDFIVSNDNNAMFSVQPSIDASGNLTYTLAANANGNAVVTVQAHDNGGTADGGVDTSAAQTFNIAATAVNDAPSFTVGTDQSAPEDSGAHTVNGFISNISDGPNEAGQVLDFIVSNNNNALFAVQPSIDASGNLTYTLAANATGSATVSVQLHDNGGTANGGVDTSAVQTFAINVSPVNDAPSFTVGADQVTLEDSGAQAVNGFVTAISTGPADEAGQTVDFIVSNNNNAMFSVQPSIDASGNLTYTLAANANGNAVISVQAHDNGGTADGGADTSAAQTFNIAATAVNDAPSFTVGTDQSAPEDSGAHTVNGFISNISDGPNEAGQVLDFIVSNNNNALFAVQPSIDASGNLTYTLAANATGSATVSVQLHDNGGTANGGVDTSAVQTFAINVSPVNDAPSFTVGADQVTLEDSGAQAVNGFVTAISTGPADEAGQTVDFIVSNDNNAMFSVQPSIDASGNLTYTLAANANGNAVISVQAHDNGGTADGGADTSAAQTFNIAATAVNDAPSFTVGTDQSAPEDSGAHTVNGFISNISDGPNEAGQVLDFIVSNNNNALFAVQPSIDASGNLTYTLAANATGSATVSVQLHDNGGTANGGVDTSAVQTFAINVSPVNDAPSFTVGADQITLEDSGAQTVNGFVTAISTGPADEAGQTVDFIVSNNNNAMFSVQPSIDASGNLTYTLAANANGNAIVTVQAHDNGGTADGGADTSAAQTFNIAAGSVNDAPAGTSNTLTILEDSSHTFSAAEFGFTDPVDAASASGANPLQNVILTTLPNPAAGTLTLNGGAVSAGQAIAVADIPNLVFTPAANASGSPEASFTFQVQDNGGTANGGVNTDASPKTFTFNVTPINDAPAGTDKTVSSQGAHTFVAADFGFTDPLDSPANSLFAVEITTLPVSGSLTLNSVPVTTGQFISATDIASGLLVFTPSGNNPGSFTFQVQDNGGTANGGVDLDPTPNTITINQDVPPVVTAGHMLNYTENQVATAFDPALTVTDVDNANLASATVQITGNYVNGQDILGFTNQNGITGSFNAATGTLTLTGSSSVANYQTALDSITYVNTSENPSGLPRTVTIITNDGTANSIAKTDTINVTPVNDAAVVTAGHTLNYTENQVATAFDPALTVTDVDNANLASATVQITGNYVNGQDVLGFTNQNGISGAFNAATGTLTLTGSSSVANYQTALASVTYFNTSENPSGLARTVTIITNDGTANSIAKTDTINVTPVNDAAVVTAGHTLNYTENQVATAFDPALTVTDVDNANLASATVQITGNYVNGQDILGFTNQNGITGSFNAATGTLTLTGSSSVANYQTALDSITYVNTSENPSGLPRTVTIITNDGTANSIAKTDTINVTPVNDAAVVTAGHTLNYTENQVATAFDPALTVTDVDNANLASATVQITGNYVNGQDVLGFTNQNGISGAFNAATGTLTLTGSSSVANYQTALASVTYFNTSENPSGLARTVTIITNDGTANSIAKTDTINVTPVNDAAVVTAGHTLNYTENQVATAFDPALTVTDVDNANLASATVQITGNYVNGQDILGFTNQNGITGAFNAATGTLTLTGSSSVANYQTALDSITYFNSSENPSGLPRTVTIITNDGTANSIAKTDTINVTPVNDAAVVTAGHTLNYTENQVATAFDPALTVTDVDNANLASATVQITGNYVNGQDVLGFTNQNGISGAFNAATGTLTLTGSSSVANYQTALASVTYFNTSENPSGLARTVTIITNDGTANSIAKTDTINVTPVNDAAVVTAGHTLNYTENQVATAFDPALTVTDVDNANLASATVQITGNYVNGQDVLGFTNQNGISGAFNAATGTLTLTGSSSVANYQTALASVTYFNTSENPSGLARTVTIITNDGTANSIAKTDTINVTPVNDAAVVTAGHTLNYTENQVATAFDPALTVTDVDNANLASATVQITGNYVNGQDILGFTNQNGISGAFNAATGTLTLTGSSSVANYQTALDSITYFNSSENPSGLPRTVTIITNDGTANSIAKTDTINVTPVNDAAVVTAGHTLNYTENQVATAFDPALTVTDVDNANLASATVQITGNYVNGQDILGFTNQNGITGSFNAATGTLTLTGSSSVANYQTALDSITYFNSSENPSGLPRTVTIITNDGTANSIAKTDTINVTPVNDAAVVTAGHTLNYTENQVATAFDPALTVTDVDNANLASATVQITGNYVNGQDVLGFTNQNGISGSFNAAVGRLTLTGSSSVANYQTALDSITYVNTSENPSGLARTVTIITNDGTANSIAKTDTINVTPVNDAAVVTAGHTLNYTENQVATAIDSTVTVADVDSANITAATVQITGNYVNGQDILGFTTQNGISGSFNAATGTLTLTGSSSVANYKTALDSVTYFNSSDNPSGADRTVSYTVNDGALNSNTSTSTIHVTPVNDAPVVTATGTLAYTENQAATAIAPALTLTDADTATISTASVQISTNYVNGQDLLAFTNTVSITGSFNAATGTMTLTGTDTVANYQAALRAVTYADNSENPSTLARTVTFTADDGQAANHLSAGSNHTITVTSVDDAPTATVPSDASIGTAFSHTNLAISGLSVADLDAGAGNVTATISSSNAGLTFSTAGLASFTNNGSHTVTLTGTVAQVNAALSTLVYNSDDGFTGSDTVTLSVNDNGNTGNGGPLGSGSQTFHVGVVPQVFVIDNTPAGAGNNGSIANPFNSIASFNANAADGSGDYVYINAGTYSEADGINLVSGEHLFGQGQTLQFTNPVTGQVVTIGTGSTGNTPIISVTGANQHGIDLGANDEVTGLNVATTLGNQIGIHDNGASVGSLTMNDIDVTGVGKAVNITHGGALNVAIDTLTSTGSSANGIQLGATGAALTGTFSAGTGANAATSSISGSTGAAFLVGDGSGTTGTGGAATITFGGAINASNAAAVADIQDHTTGTVTLSGNLTHSGNGAGIVLDDNSSNFTFSGTSNSLTSNASTAISITDQSGGTVAFSGPLNIDTTSGTGVNLGGTNTGATFSFSGGNHTIDTTGGNGFVATGGGTVNVTGTGNHINSGSGTALNISNTTIGTSDVTFHDISSGSAANSSATGIILDSTGSSGGLHVTGTGATAGSGGTIQHKTGVNGSTTSGICVYLNNTSDVQLNDMQLNDFDNFAIRGISVTGFTLDNTIINGTNGNNNAGGSEEGSIRFDNLLGTASITNSSISGGGTFNVDVENTAAGSSLDRLTMSNNTFGLISSTIGNDNVDVTARPTGANTATLNVTLENNQFLGARSDFFETIADGNSTMDVVARGNTFTNGQTIISGGGVGISIRGDVVGTADHVTYDVQNNNINDSNNSSFTVGIFVAKGNGAGTWTGTIANNTITGSTANLNAAGDGIFVRAAGSGSLTTLIQNNILSHYGNAGIHLQNNDGSSTMNASVFGNTESNPNNQIFAGLFADNGATGTDTSAMNLVVGSAATPALQNTFNGGASIDVSLSNFNASTTFNLSREGSASGTVAGVIQDDNVGSPSVDTSGGAGAITLVTANTVRLMVSPTSPYEDGSTDTTYTFLRYGDTSSAQTINFTVGGTATFNTDYTQSGAATFTASTGTVTFAAGSGVATITINPTADLTLESNETVTLTLAAGGGYTAATPSAATSTILNDDVTPLLAAPGGVASASGTPGETHLTQVQLNSVVAAAIAQWADAGATPAQLAKLAAVTFTVADLAGNTIGDHSAGKIVIDTDAAGHGWFVDPTPNDNSEFTHAANAASTDLSADPSNAAAGHLDLLTAVVHEMGHQLGLPDLSASSSAHDLMFINLVDGERRLPTTADVAQAGGGTFSFAAVGTTAPADAAPASAAAPISGGHGGHPLLARLADNFHFAHVSADVPAPLPQTHAATGSSLVRGGAFDFSGLRSQFHASDFTDAVLHVAPEAGGFWAQLHDMLAARHGEVTPAAGWSGLAPMFGAHAGDHVNALPISPLLANYLAQHVDLHI